MNAPAQQVQSRMDIPRRFPLVSKTQTRTSVAPFTSDARLINCYAEYDPQDKEFWIYKRMGLGATPAFSAPGAALGYGSYTHPGTGLVLYVFNAAGTATLYWGAVGSGTLTSIGTVDATAPYFFETVQSAPQTIALANGKSGYTLNVDTLVLTAIASAGFPAIQMPGWAYVDGTLYVMDQFGNIAGSNINDATTWSALNTIAASSNADVGVALAKQLNYVVAFKSYTTQIFYDAGNPTGSPLSPVPDAQIPLGCAAPLSVQQIDNSLLWMTSNQVGSPQVAMMDNLTPKIISTPAVDRILDGAKYTTAGAFFNRGSHTWVLLPAVGISSWVLKHAGHRFYGLNVQNLNLTLVYDMDQELWYIWQDANGNWWPIVYMNSGAPSASAVGVHYAQHSTNGNVYFVDADYVYTNDFGTVFPVDIYTPNFDGGTNRRKYLKTMYFNGDQTPGSTLLVRFTDDDFQSWSNPRQVDLGLKKPRLTDCGTFIRRRAYHFRHQSNTALRIKTVDIQMDIGTL
jgi:hypothetical protein